MKQLELCVCGNAPETIVKPNWDYETGCSCGRAGMSSYTKRIAHASWNRLAREEKRQAAKAVTA